jgi:hypothetical protein
MHDKWMNRYKQPLNKGKLFFFINAWLAQVVLKSTAHEAHLAGYP